MRIHQLEVTAFGPFPGIEVIDFDALTSAGLFLLCGATGAGKTSVLDAICFGLYGEVPGDRNSAKRLRSDHAAPGVAPVVLLEVSINARRFRIRRSPAWQRPKRRGSGTVLEQARVNLEELVAGDWIHHSNRLDETGHLVTELLGMTVGQFCQVALLPQGRFQAFLRARSDERHKVLQQLFRTSRFEDIERWLVRHRQSLKATTQGHQEAAAAVVSRISEVAATEVPDHWDLHDLAMPAEAGQVAAWGAELLNNTVAVQTEIATALRSATTGTDDARRRLADAHRIHDLRGKHAEAIRVEQALEEAHPEAEKARSRLDSARRAGVVAPLLNVARQATAAAEVAERDLGAALADAARRLGADALALTHDDLASAERDALVAATTARALLPREAELRNSQQAVESAALAMAELEDVATELEERCTAIPAELANLRPGLIEQWSRAARSVAVDQAERLLLGQVAAAEKLQALQVQLEEARGQHRATAEHALLLGQRMHDIREARINGMAAELAAVLASGDSCPVCGSAEHPSLAMGAVGAPAKVDEERARSAYETADFTRQAHEEAVRTLEKNCALARQTAGNLTVDTLQAELRAVHQERLACQRAPSERDRIAARIERLEQELVDLQARARSVEVDTARLSEQRESAQAVVTKVSAQLAEIFSDDEVAESVARLIETKTSAGAAFAEAREAIADRDASLSQSGKAHGDALDCAREHGFSTCETAATAVLDPKEVQALERRLRERETLKVKAAVVLCDPEVQEAVAAELPDLDARKAAVSLAGETLASCDARSHLVAGRLDRLRRLQVELITELDRWAPIRAAYSVAQSMSAFAEGKGSDNALQMRLSAYVLAARLQQVVAAANERLSTMSDQRYALEHSAARGVGELRGGLSLLVRDEWTGESRDPATLSGGETFVASLALALGLADVVTAEAGGSNIDTLFIDEGFGTLDPDTLDDVMDTLDGLRDGGRVVGIVSHVPELRTRVTSALQIHKERSGSRVAATREAV